MTMAVLYRCWTGVFSASSLKQRQRAAMVLYVEVLTWPELIQPVLPIKTASVVGAMVSVYVWCAEHLMMRDWRNISMLLVLSDWILNSLSCIYFY